MTGTGHDAAAPAAAATGAPHRGLSASGHICFWQGASLWIGIGQGQTHWHAHHAHQLALALDGRLRFRSGRNGPWSWFDAAFVPSQRPHQFALDGVTVAHLFVEPASREGRALAQRFGTDALSALPPDPTRDCATRLRDVLRASAGAPALQAAGRATLAMLADTGAAATHARQPIDPRLACAMEHVRQKIRAPVTLAEAARVACLSPSRFRHRFVAETGTTFRAYVLWLRINLAIESVTAGASWTEAAHAAGFADSAHLSRTHRRMFGIEPTAIRLAARRVDRRQPS